MYKARVREGVVDGTLHNMIVDNRSMVFMNNGKNSGIAAVSIIVMVAEFRIIIEDCWLRAKSRSLIAAKQEELRRCGRWGTVDWQRGLLDPVRGVVGGRAMPARVRHPGGLHRRRHVKVCPTAAPKAKLCWVVGGRGQGGWRI
jgi:hypothetical protein